MATRGLLHHPLHARPPSYIADPRHLLPSRSSFSSDGFSVTPFRRRLALRSVKCMKVEDPADAKVKARDTPQAQLESSDTDVVEYVNKAAPGPMVEVDPVTVFRRIIAERRASLAMFREKQRDAAAIMQSTAPQPFLLGSKWSGKSTIAIFLALVLLVLAAVSYFLRSRTDREKQTELTLTEGKDNVDVSTDNGRRKLVKDTIKAPESVLTAMAIGAASVGRFTGQTDSTHDTAHAGNGNLVDTQRPAGGAGANSSVKTTETTSAEDMTSEGHGIPAFGQVSYNPSNVEAFSSFKTQNAGVDVTEGPWFAQAADDAGNPQSESSIQSASVAQDVVFEDVLAQKEEVHVSTEAVIHKLANEISVSEVRYETLRLNNVVDGEFLGEVVSVSVATEEAVEVSDNSAQIENFKFEEPEDDVFLADSSTIVEKLEQMIGQESISTMEGKSVVGKADVSEQNLLTDGPTLELPNDQTGLMDTDTGIGNTDSDSEDSESDEHYEVTQSLTPSQVDKVAPLEATLSDDSESDEQHEVTQSFTSLQVDKVASLEASDSEIDDEGQATGSLDVEEHGDTIELLSGVDQTLERIETELDDVLDNADNSKIGKVGETISVGPNCSDGGVDRRITDDKPLSASQTNEELQTDASLSLNQVNYQDSGAMAYGSTEDATLESLEEDPREDNKKALEAALPALAIGVGTIGTVFGVAGGLQVVGFAALTSFLSQDFFWAQSREELFQELKGITNRQKLLDFLARRNIVRKDQEESSL